MDAILSTDAYTKHLGVHVTDWGGGWATATLMMDDRHTNFAGTAHGGVTFSLGDVVFAVSSNSWGRLAVALAVDVQFLAAGEVGDVLTATSRERHRTRRTAAYLIEVRSGPDPSDGGSLVASLHAMVHRTDRWHLGVDAWSAAWRDAH